MKESRREIQKARRERAKKRDRVILLSLLGLLTTIVLAFIITERESFSFPKWTLPKLNWFLGGEAKESSEQQEEQVSGLYAPGQQVGLKASASQTANGKSLEAFKNRLALITKVGKEKKSGRLIYQLQFSDDQKLSQVYEEDLEVVETTFTLGQEVELLDRDGAARVTQISQEPSGFVYQILLETGEVFEELTDSQLAFVYDIPLQESYSPAENNRLIQEAIDLSQDYTFSVLRFPKGRFKIGSHTPDQEYIILRSNIELRGQETTLEVNGSARWYGLATGQTAFDGLSYFLMNGLHVEANDLEKGNQFIIMANHGHSWQIKNNRFTQVHQMSSHVFDLGGIQYATFEDNVFEGYAPELTTVTEFGDRNLHNFYAEAIQLDESSVQTGWDGGFMTAIDPNYQWSSITPIMSSHITITRNQFLPYSHEGKLIAYGATIGQHSSLVGQVSITHNTFKETLTKRFQDPKNPNWVLEPIHLNSTQNNEIRDNVFD
ncbi:hypothetical protein [Streptococcus ovuberis]|uniref:Uncharacterized protein n=1 Tax=Streptococcus ovuberis TaxID=1936207 RepID=A0A7X6MXS0_9STRE|nr:hypothetical protein [Streptococcus ovuberis]NKZ20320.1 hypothetical protein [Streptococcus ovuberis]